MATLVVRGALPGKAQAESIECGDGGATIANNGPNTVYYRDEEPVSRSVNDGSLTSGSSTTLYGTAYFVVDEGATASRSDSATLQIALQAATTTAVAARAATLFVAASDASTKAKAGADYVCDGTADEAEINTALAALSSTTGGVVQLSEGTFNIDSPVLLLKDKQHLRGVGWYATTIQNRTGQTPTQLVQVSSAGTGNLNFNVIDSLLLKFSDTPATGHGIVASSNGFRVHNVYIRDIPQDGIVLSSQTTPLEFAEQSLLDLRMFNIGRDGVVTSSDIYDLVIQNVRIGNTFNTTGRHGFNLAGPYVHLVNCRVNDFLNGQGCKLTGVTQATIVGCHFDENGAGALAAGNGINGFGGVGIYADSGTRVGIDSCGFNNNDSYDIYFASLSNSHVTGCQHAGAGTKGPKEAMIYVTGADGVVVADNNLVDATKRAVVVASSANCIVHDNQVTNPLTTPSQASIRLFSTTNSHVHHNRVANGISEESSSDNNTIADNRLSGGSIATVGASTVVGQTRALGRAATNAMAGTNADGLWLPRHYGLLAHTFPGYLAVNSGGTSSAGVLMLTKMWVPRTLSVTNIVVGIATAGATLTSAQCLAAIFDSTGTRLGVTGDQSAVWTSLGLKSMAVTGGPIAVTGGEDVFVWIGMLWNGTTGPGFSAIGNFASTVPALLNQGMTASQTALGTILSGQTSMPASITPASIAQAGTRPYWFGLS